MDQCSPDIKFDFTCFSKDALIKIAQRINQVKRTKISTSGARTKKQLWDDIMKELRSVCDNAGSRTDYCVASQASLANDPEFMNKYFRPPKPEGKYTWLSNFEICDVLRGYERKFSDFKSFGPVPCDFLDIPTDLNGAKLPDLYESGIKRIGMVSNTAKSGTNGEHWVSFFMDLSSPTGPWTLEYYDSLGKKPYKEMMNYLKLLQAYIKIKMNRDAVIKINPKKTQKKSPGDCGIWAIDFIVSRLNGKTFEDYLAEEKTEETINKCRDFYFNKK